MKRTLPQSGIDFINDLESREKTLSKMLDDISDTCFSGKATLDEIMAKHDAFFQLLETINMDLRRMTLEFDQIVARADLFNRLMNSLLALFAGSCEGSTKRANDIVDSAIGRWGIRYDSFFEE